MKRSLANTVKASLTPYIWPFFQVFPYEGLADISRVDARGAICKRDRFLFNRIPKCGNSTVLTALAAHSAKKWDAGMPVANAKDYFTRPAFVNKATAREIKDSYFKFVIIRDPFSRTLSAYLDKIVQTKSENFRKKAQRRTGKTPENFLEFCKYLVAGGHLDDMHWGRQTDCLLLPLDAFDTVARFENLETDLSSILTTVYGTPGEEITRAGPPPTHAASKLENYYCPESEAIVRDVMAADFKTFGYPTSL